MSNIEINDEPDLYLTNIEVFTDERTTREMLKNSLNSYMKTNGYNRDFGSVLHVKIPNQIRNRDISTFYGFVTLTDITKHGRFADLNHNFIFGERQIVISLSNELPKRSEQLCKEIKRSMNQREHDTEDDIEVVCSKKPRTDNEEQRIGSLRYIKDMIQEHLNRYDDLTEREEEIKDKEMVIAHREDKLDTLEKAIKQKGEELALREKMLIEKEIKIRDQEEDLNKEKQKLAEKKASIGEILKQLI